jgi:hypothetical protein
MEAAGAQCGQIHLSLQCAQPVLELLSDESCRLLFSVNLVQPPPTAAALDAAFPFQSSCCELCGSLCSPLSLYYRDTGTVLYRVQQHCRKLVPTVMEHQAFALSTARSAQRGVLDVADSLTIVETLNGPVEKSLGDVARVAQRAAKHAAMAHAELTAAAARRDERRLEQLNASNSLPTTPRGVITNQGTAAGTPRGASRGYSTPGTALETPMSSTIHLRVGSSAGLAPPSQLSARSSTGNSTPSRQPQRTPLLALESAPTPSASSLHAMAQPPVNEDEDIGSPFREHNVNSFVP